MSDHPLYARHRETLERAVQAISERSYWSAYPESIKPYGPTAVEDGKAAYESRLGTAYALDTPGADGMTGGERSPYGPELGVTYPHVGDIDALFAATTAALPAWRDAGADARAGVCLEILARLNARSVEIALAAQHTTGQAFGMAFQAAGPHAQDRGLEAVAYAYAEMTRHPREATWEKPGKAPITMTKSFRIAPRGVALVVGCNTFPTWNGYPGLFASLVTGNPVVVKPHPRAVLPLAITVEVCQEVLREADSTRTSSCSRPRRRARGSRRCWHAARGPPHRLHRLVGLRRVAGAARAPGPGLHREGRRQRRRRRLDGRPAGDDRQPRVLPVALLGQMCTTPQNILVPRGGIETDEGHKSFDEVAAAIGTAVEKLLADDARATALLGAVVNDNVLERIERAPSYGRVVLESRAVKHPEYADATVRTPVIVALDATDESVYTSEHFGPISFVIATESTEDSLRILKRTVSEHGAITAAVYSTSPDVIAAAQDAALDAGVALSENLTSAVYVNQSAAFSDFHATGANPAANSALTDGAFVAGRFRVIQSRRHVAPAG
jgi:acyl-CoA reductase-like NAD-dependent aldehyde dehydrogenase